MLALEKAATRTLSRTQQAIVRTLLYFDVFGHPLSEEEVARFSDLPRQQLSALHAELNALCDEGVIARSGPYFGFGNVDALVRARLEENERAATRMRKAYRMSRLIGRFPFVRAVMLSGSISKGRMAADGDIDYFVITAPDRLWVARTLLVLFKKIFLLNSRRDFCVNYFVDTDHLCIEDRNLFTAMELRTLIPTFNAPLCEAFFEANDWAKHLLPNTSPPDASRAAYAHGPLKRALERSLVSGLGDELDEWFMLRTLRYWKHKFAELDRAQFDVALRTRRYVSKHHPRNFQKRVLDAFQQRIARFERDHDTALG